MEKKSVVEEIERAEMTRYASLSVPLRIWFLILTIAGLALAVVWVFNFSYRGMVFYPAQYYYLLIAFFSSNAFLVLPARRKDTQVPWYDITAAALTFCIGGYLCLHYWEISNVGWIPAPPFAMILGILLSILILEGGRRMAGNVYLVVCIMFALYPVFAEHMPGILFGKEFSFAATVGIHVYGSEGLLGLPVKTMGDILIGFLLFAAVLIASGAGKFFVKFALATFGRFRGGPAKVSCLSSAMFGTVSGSAVSNVVADGPVTIPTMIGVGFSPARAAAIEACTSTGGVLMPPVMGAVAFVMASFLGVEYRDVCIAAIVPSVLYYFGLLMQIDAYSARRGLKGLTREQIPSFKKTLQEGWHFLVVLAFLAWGLLFMGWEIYTAFYACILMVVISYVNRETRMTPKRLIGAIATAGQLISTTMAALMPVGFIVAGLITTGSAASFTSGLVKLGGNSAFLILVFGAVASYILGMAGMLVSAYIFLAVTLAPAVIQIGGLNKMAVHLFICYWAMLSCITPPVAMAVFVASAIAKCEPMKAGIHAIRLAIVIYFVPFFFVYNPALILQGESFLGGVFVASCAVLGVAFIAAGTEGYLWLYGKVGAWPRAVLIVGGFLIVFPENYTTIVGAALIGVTLLIISLARNAATAKTIDVLHEKEGGV